jgi:hypothetical protein
MPPGKFEHECRQVFTYLLNHIEPNLGIKQFNINEYEKNKYYTIDELKKIINYNEIKYYFPVRRPEFLKVPNRYSERDTSIYLEIDCYNEYLKIGLEVDSKDHNECDYNLDQQEYDKIKDKKCIENDVLLFRISYKNIKTVRQIKEYLYNKINDSEIILYNFDYDYFIDDNNQIINNMIKSISYMHDYKIINIIKKLEQLYDNNCKINSDIINITHCTNKIKIICNNNHEYKTRYVNISSFYRIRGCNKCNKYKINTTEDINEKTQKINIKLINKYKGPSGKNQLFECMSIFKHITEMSWDNMYRKVKDNTQCEKCDNILDYVKIYKYEINGNYTNEVYDNVKFIPNLSNNLKDSDFWFNIRKHIKTKNTKECFGYKWSFIRPQNDKLIRYRNEIKNYDLNEQEIIKLLNFDISIPEVKKGNNRLTDKKDDKRCNKVNPVIKVDLDTKTILAEYSQPSEAIEKELINGFTKDIINKGCNAYKKEKSLVNITKAKKRIVFMYKDNNQLDLS